MSAVSGAPGAASTTGLRRRPFVLAVVDAWIALGIFAGMVLAAFCKSPENHVTRFCAIIATVSTFATLTYIFQTLDKIWAAYGAIKAHYRGSVPSVGVYTAGYEFGKVAFAITLTTLLWKPAANPIGAINPVPPTDGPSLVFVAPRATERDTLARFTVFFPENADGPPSWRRGISLTRTNKALLNDLMGALDSCADGDRFDPVRLSVRGFANTDSFGRKRELDSDSLNLAAANLRGGAVARYIDSVALMRGGRGVAIDSAYWTSLTEMEHHRQFRDRFTAATRAEAGALNRRAEIALLAAGRCTVLIPPTDVTSQAANDVANSKMTNAAPTAPTTGSSLRH